VHHEVWRQCYQSYAAMPERPEQVSEEALFGRIVMRAIPQAAAQPGIAADRFAREIVGF
jgi:hypothetical protein